ncbi:MAG TPA: epoxyqueuosine reductase [Patescibacteria group bacterium]|nr:epoxyqueuosine reductase [Patescibacteria group bacterium]
MHDDPARWMEKVIKDFIAGPMNTMQKWGDEPAWAEPIVGYSSGADPLYEFYKQDIGGFYLSPLEFISHAYPGKEFKAEDLTVVSWILPQTEATKRDHRKETHFPSERWARSRIFGEEVNVMLREHVVEKLAEEDVEAAAPMLSPLWKGATSEKYLYASTWSERHAAYAAGLGTFGLSDGLITPRGKAMRTGSVVVNIRIDPTPRPYTDHHAYCLFYAKGACSKCMERCPIGAITEEGHDKRTCRLYVNMTREYVPSHYGFDGYGCGFCQTAVPCESNIPKELEP